MNEGTLTRELPGSCGESATATATTRLIARRVVDIGASIITYTILGVPS